MANTSRAHVQQQLSFIESRLFAADDVSPHAAAPHPHPRAARPSSPPPSPPTTQLDEDYDGAEAEADADTDLGLLSSLDADMRDRVYFVFSWFDKDLTGYRKQNTLRL